MWFSGDLGTLSHVSEPRLQFNPKASECENGISLGDLSIIGKVKTTRRWPQAKLNHPCVSLGLWDAGCSVAILWQRGGFDPLRQLLDFVDFLLKRRPFSVWQELS
jgi:hypothetical protein